MSKIHLAVLIALLYLPFAAKSQSRSENLFKEHNSLSFFFSPRVQYFTPSQSFLFYEGAAVFNKNFPIGHSFPLNSISDIYNTIGYEHKASENWYLGISGTLRSRFARTIPSYRINITHIGNIKSFKFIKEVSLHYIDNPKSDNPHVIVSDEGIVSFYFKLLKRFKLSNSQFVDAYIGYRPSIYFDYVNDNYSAYDGRTIDFTRGFLGVNYSISNSVLVGVYAAKETSYWYRGVKILDVEKVNTITPVVGLNFTYLFKQNRENQEESPYYYFRH
ncbi:MAG TPA: hypothetical protein VIK89_01875 [Cytophagaceae bacterium]